MNGLKKNMNIFQMIMKVYYYYGLYSHSLSFDSFQRYLFNIFPISNYMDRKNIIYIIDDNR